MLSHISYIFIVSTSYRLVASIYFSLEDFVFRSFLFRLFVGRFFLFLLADIYHVLLAVCAAHRIYTGQIDTYSIEDIKENEVRVQLGFIFYSTK